MTRGLSGVPVCLFLICTATHSRAQIYNAWTNGTSGSWQDPYWSQGLPGPGHWVMITNAGWKAVAITPTTVQNAPDSLHVSQIILGSPVDSYNVLLLNYAGFDTVITASIMTINSNTALVALASELQVGGSTGDALHLGGMVNQGDYAQISARQMFIGDVGPGAYYMTNGSCIVYQATQTYLGTTNFTGLFDQMGGAASFLSLTMENSEYDLRDGTLACSGTLLIGQRLGARFNQTGGSNSVANLLSEGSQYDLSGGSLMAPTNTLNRIYETAGSFNQSGGVASGQLFNLRVGYANMSGGLLAYDNLIVGESGPPPQPPGSGTFIQTGGTNRVTENLSLGPQSFPLNSGSYNLSSNAVLTTRITSIATGTFNQSGGTHTVSGGLRLSGFQYFAHQAINYSIPVYQLSGGSLASASTILTLAHFTQTGGTNLGAGVTLNQSDYVLTGGQLTADVVEVQYGSTFHHGAGLVLNSPVLTLVDSTWSEEGTGAQLGPLQLLGIGTTRSTLPLPTNGCVLTFQDSRYRGWSTDATLTIENWKGSVGGGGSHQIVFGNSSAALTPQQLSLIKFHNPRGTPGTFPATILATGEIVPGQFVQARLTSSRKLVLEWAPGFTLQSATNVPGPYSDVNGATSPYTNQFTDPQRFFRLRQ